MSLLARNLIRMVWGKAKNRVSMSGNTIFYVGRIFQLYFHAADEVPEIRVQLCFGRGTCPYFLNRSVSIRNSAILCGSSPPLFLFVGFLKAAVWDSALYLGKVRQNPCEFIRAMQLNIMA